MNSSKWTFIDLFAGIGGMRIPGGLYTLYTTVSSRSAVVDFLGWGGASYHRQQAMRTFLETIQANRPPDPWKICCMRLAPYTPQENPVEDIGLKGKTFVRTHALWTTNFEPIKDLFVEGIRRKKTSISLSYSNIQYLLNDVELLYTLLPHRAIGREFWQEPNFLEEKKYQQRFVSVKNIQISKRPIQIEPKSGLHDTPENMLKLNGAANGKLQFNELVGKPKRKIP